MAVMAAAPPQPRLQDGLAVVFWKWLRRAMLEGLDEYRRTTKQVPHLTDSSFMQPVFSISERKSVLA
jgi:hypothetical protein